MFRILLTAFLFSALSLPALAFVPWKMTKTAWSAADEKNYQVFIRGIGEAIESRRCNSVPSCMRSAANPYRSSDPAGLAYRSDCADLVYYLRAYFSWKNGLPFSFATEMSRRNIDGNTGDIRYARFGNVVSAKRDTVAVGGQYPDALQLLNNTIPDLTVSSNFRFYYKDNDTGPNFVDLYPAKLDRSSIVPGSVIYDPNGHVTTVYKITDDGKIYYLDAHPDNSVSQGLYTVKFVRSNPGQGAGFKNWRPIRLVGAAMGADGAYVGGQIVATPNAQLPNYGLEQFLGNGRAVSDLNWGQSQFFYNGNEVSYYDYVRFKMAKGDLRINPLADMKASVDDLCASLKDRVTAVDLAVKAGIQNKSHPDRLPINIYGSEGEWESFSSPSRDARLKVSYRDLIDQSSEQIQKFRARDPSVVYPGSNLAQDLLNVYRQQANSCRFAYTNSNGQLVNLSLEDIRLRLFALSFDPYACVEARWGAVTGSEAQSCRDDQTKRLWYAREQRLRNQSERKYDLKMGFSLDDLAVSSPANGVGQPADVDLPGFLRSQGAGGLF